MANMTTLKQPCMLYEPTFEHHEMEKVKITFVQADGATRSKKVPVFTGKTGIEGLLYVEDRFRNACAAMGATRGQDLFELFKEVVQDTAESTWETIVQRNPARSVARFNANIQEFYLHYVDGQARDTMMDYLRALRRPVKADP